MKPKPKPQKYHSSTAKLPYSTYMKTPTSVSIERQKFSSSLKESILKEKDQAASKANGDAGKLTGEIRRFFDSKIRGVLQETLSSNQSTI